MSRTERIDEFQQRHPALGGTIATLYKFQDDQGLYLSALIAYYGFLSLFPLLLLLTSILGFVLQNNPAFEHRILDSTLRQFPVIGDQLSDPHGLRGNGVALVVSLLVAVYGALGVAHAIQTRDERDLDRAALPAGESVAAAPAQHHADRHRRTGDHPRHRVVGYRQQRHRLRC